MVETVFSVFDQLANSCPSRFFANAIVGAKHHETVRGAHRERVPRTGDHDGVAVDRSSPEDGRGAGDTRAGVSALRCVPHRARALAPSPTCRPTVRLTILPFHAGAVPSGTTEYTNVQIANEEWSPGTSPSFLPRNAPRRPAVSRRSGHFASARGVAASPSRDRYPIETRFLSDGRRRDECARDARTTRTAFRVSFPDSRRPSGYGAMRTPSRVTAHAPRSRAFRPRRDDFRERQGEPADWRAGQRRELVSGHRVRVRRERRAK